LRSTFTNGSFVHCVEDDDDDDLIMEDEPTEITTPSRKRKANGASDADLSTKKLKRSIDANCQEDEDIVVL